MKFEVSKTTDDCAFFGLLAHVCQYLQMAKMYMKTTTVCIVIINVFLDTSMAEPSPELNLMIDFTQSIDR